MNELKTVLDKNLPKNLMLRLGQTETDRHQ